jgi:hypothetical protein
MSAGRIAATIEDAIFEDVHEGVPGRLAVTKETFPAGMVCGPSGRFGLRVLLPAPWQFVCGGGAGGSPPAASPNAHVAGLSPS